MNNPSQSEAIVLEVERLETLFNTSLGAVHAVNSIDFSLRRGEILGVVGESGSGKTVSMMSLLRLLPSPPADIRNGTARFSGNDLLALPPDALRKVRGNRIGFIFQDPMTSLNPVFKVGSQLAEPLILHRDLTKKQALERAAELLDLVGIPDAKARLSDYPHQFSGGMRQRVMIAMALACDPEILIADEPTTALDVTIQAQIIELVQDIQNKLGMAIIWITHDLGVIAEIADRVLVMYGGQIVEEAPVEELFKNPRHPYTRALLDSVPSLSDERSHKLASIKGQPPILMARPSSCSFYERCPFAGPPCLEANPEKRELSKGHYLACFFDIEKKRWHRKEKLHA